LQKLTVLREVPFFPPFDKLGTKTGTGSSCEETESVNDEFNILSETSFVFENVTYNVHDYISQSFSSEWRVKGPTRLEEM
jgi:hypothetical protein